MPLAALLEQKRHSGYTAYKSFVPFATPTSKIVLGIKPNFLI